MAEKYVEKSQQQTVHSRVQKIQQKLQSSSERPGYSELQEKLESSEREKEEMKEQLIRSQEEMMEMRKQIKEMSLQIQNQEQEEEALTASGEGELPQCEQHLKQKEKKDLLELSPEQEMKTVNTLKTKLNVLCRMKKDAIPITLSRGSAATDKNFAYFVPAGSTILYQYSWNTETWRLLPTRPLHQNSALVVINGALTTVGGVDKRFCRRNTLLSLQEYKWIEKYPPMKKCRSSPAAILTPSGHCLIVMGGLGICSIRSKSVELFVLSTESWYELTELPKPLPRPCSAICGSELYVINDNEGFSCSLRHFESGKVAPSTHALSWKPLPKLPVKETACASLCNRLVVVGGFQCSESKDDKNPALDQEFLHMQPCLETCDSILQLVRGEWVTIGYMRRARRECLAVSPLSDKMLIVGGWKENTVEECLVME